MNLFLNQLQNDKYLGKEKATKISLTVSTIEVLEARYWILCCTFRIWFIMWDAPHLSTHHIFLPLSFGEDLQASLFLSSSFFSQYEGSGIKYFSVLFIQQVTEVE